MKEITKILTCVALAILMLCPCFLMGSCKNDENDKKKPDEPFGEQIDIYKDYTLPVLEISTVGGNVVSKIIEQGCSASVKNAEDELSITNMAAKIKGFGDAVWLMEKKSYLLSFDQKINLLGAGSGEASDWVLMANHGDYTMLRNHLAYTVAKNILTNIGYVSGSAFAQLYINGEYLGMYQVLERVQFDENRLNYTFEQDVDDTSYLVKIDSAATTQIDAAEGTNYFTISSKTFYIENQGVSEKQCTYLSSYYSEMMTAVNNGVQASVEKYIDVDSLVDIYILHEFFKNADVGNSGFYMVKEKGGKIVFTAPWDFYGCAGNDESLTDTTASNLCAGNGTNKHDGANPITYRMMRRNWFIDKVVARWEQVKADLLACAGELDAFYNAHKSDIEANYEKWDVWGVKTHKQPVTILKLKSYEENLDQLRSFIEKRYTWMEKTINTKQIYSQSKD